MLAGRVSLFAKRILAAAGSVAAFLTVPQLYFMGASHHETLLAGFDLMPQQFPTALDQIIYAGFNVAVATWVGAVFYNIGLILSLMVCVLCGETLIRACFNRRDLDLAAARIKASADLAGEKLGWMKSIGVALVLVGAVYAVTGFFVSVVKAGSELAKIEASSIRARARSCTRDLAANEYRCVKYSAANRSVTGVPLDATESLTAIVTGGGASIIKNEDVVSMSAIPASPGSAS